MKIADKLDVTVSSLSTVSIEQGTVPTQYSSQTIYVKLDSFWLVVLVIQQLRYILHQNHSPFLILSNSTTWLWRDKYYVYYAQVSEQYVDKFIQWRLLKVKSTLKRYLQIWMRNMWLWHRSFSRRSKLKNNKVISVWSFWTSPDSA